MTRNTVGQIRVQTPVTTDGTTLAYDENKQVQYKTTYHPATARREMESIAAKQPAHLRPIITDVAAKTAATTGTAEVIGTADTKATSTKPRQATKPKAAQDANTQTVRTDAGTTNETENFTDNEQDEK